MDQGNDVRSPKSSLLTGEGASGSKSNSASDHIKAPPRDDFARQEPRRGRKLRTVVGAIAVLGLGWVIGLNSQFDIAQSKVWLDQGAINLSSAWTSLQRGFVDRVEHLAGRNTPAAEGAFGENKPNNADALERVADNLSSKLDQMRASSEGLARDLTVELERLRGSMDRSQGELVAKFTQLAERVERLEQTQPVHKQLRPGAHRGSTTDCAYRATCAASRNHPGASQGGAATYSGRDSARAHCHQAMAGERGAQWDGFSGGTRGLNRCLSRRDGARNRTC